MPLLEWLIALNCLKYIFCWSFHIFFTISLQVITVVLCLKPKWKEFSNVSTSFTWKYISYYERKKQQCFNQMTASDQALPVNWRNRNNWSRTTKTSFIISFTFSLLAVLFELTRLIFLMMPEFFSSNCKRATEFTPSSFQMFQTIISPHRWHSNRKQEVGMYVQCTA